MILYFADRKMNILGYATTQLKSTYLIVDDKKTEEVESGISSFECEVSWASKDRLKLETMMDAGNYILRSNGNEKDFLTIIETNIDTSKQTISVYAEDAGMDLLNEVAMPFTADKAYDIAHYIGLYAIDTGFEIGINEIPNLARKLSWDGETTCTERIASIATQFDNAEISYSFETKGLLITHKYINIFKKRGKDTGEQLRLGYEIASIATNKSVANLATSLRVTGGIPDGKEEPITLNGYKYDDGDFYVSGSRLSSRKALAIWSRYVWDREPNKLNGYTGHIVQAYSYDTTSQQELCAHAITKLKKLCQMEVNYEADIIYLPENVKIGDRVNVVDNEGRLYASTRVLRLETSVTGRKRTATLGEYLIKDSGISEKVRDLARQFAESTASVSRANIKAEAAKAAADAAKAKAEEAEDVSNAAKKTAEGAKSTADSALASANEAQNTANAARDAAGEVTEKVTGIVKDVNDAKTAADNAWKAASTAKEDAATAKTSAANAEKNAADAKTAADAAGTKSDEAVSTATAAQSDAAKAKTNA
ncbi:MAG: phage tail spike protein, partial [Coprococcus catus]|nr:phage tail spike protein [Coprococcus catus]